MRFKIIQYTYFFLILLIILRLSYWQIIRSDDLVALAEQQRLTSKDVPASRGTIFFSDGSTLASNEPKFFTFAQPKLIKDKQIFARTLAEIFFEKEKMDGLNDVERVKKYVAIESEIISKISKDLFWVSLNYEVDIETKKRIDKLELSGIGFDQTSSRFYPEGSSSAHLLGFVSSDIFGKDTGYFGLEGFYNGELRGRNGLLTREKDAQGLPILIGNFLQRKPVEGKSLILNIDRTVQSIVEEKLKVGMEKYGAKGVSAIVMDPKTGNVLAMASLPSYDPANPEQYPKESYKNPLIAEAFEPGSTFKVIVMASAINEGVVKEDTICDICSGPINLSGFTIRTWDNKYREGSSMTDVIIHSDNTGMVFAARKLGRDKMYSYLENFGFGNLTGIDLQDEQTPTLRDKDGWKEIDLATASFGQGIAVTGLQMVKAVSSIANEGKLMEPHVVRIIKDGTDEFMVTPRQVGQPINKETADVIRKMMVRAVDEGESKFAKPKGFKIAGKTGTAQIPVAGHYDPSKTIASFVGFAPADNPKFVMLVRYLEPSTSIFGSETAAPTFFEIAKDLFLYYGIAPDEANN